MSYTVLARRYRSESFDDVVGQEAPAQTLKNAIETGRVAHAYLFTGTRGVGKTTMARILAKALNCLEFDEPTTTPCCKCESCQAIAEGNDIDVIEIDGASNTGVDNIRELRQNAIYKPARSRFKIYIIDEVHMLSSGAFNALLKTLEEPPEHVKFIFATTESNKILPTILSRCQRFDFRNISAEEIASHLTAILKEEKVEAEDKLIRRVARLANGSMRDGLSLLDQILSMAKDELTLDMLNELLGTPGRERVTNLVASICGEDTAGALTQIDDALQAGLSLEQVIDSLQGHFRDLMILRNCGSDSELVDETDKECRTKLSEQSEKFDDSALVYYITVMEELKRAVKTSGSGRALLEAAIVRICASDRFSDTSALIKKLQSLPAGGGGGAVSPGAAAAAGGSPANASGAKSGYSRQGTSAASARAANDGIATGGGASGSGLKLPAEVTNEWLKSHWADLLHELRKTSKNLVSYIASAHITSFENGNMVITYPAESAGMITAMERIPSVKTGIEAGFGKLLNMKVTLVAKAAEGGGHSKKNSRIVAPGARPSQQENNDAVQDENVQMVLKELGGKITGIEKLPDEH